MNTGADPRGGFEVKQMCSVQTGVGIQLGNELHMSQNHARATLARTRATVLWDDTALMILHEAQKSNAPETRSHIYTHFDRPGPFGRTASP